MTDLLDDSRNRPVVFETRAEPGQHRVRPHLRVLAGASLVVAALGGAAAITFGGSALWSVVGSPGGVSDTPAPLWIPPPRGVTTPQPQQDHTATVDRDHSTITAPTTSHHPSATHVPGADDPPNHEAIRHTVTTATAQPRTQEQTQQAQTQAPTTSQSEPEPGDDHHRGAGGGGPHGGGSSGHG
ncbi:MAG TPA: hypothetical protein VJX10_10470 [Pseudonocardiaceae bacterium]|nr:hypothetical protein [Pseudonocardiaceae bacterium]